MRLKISCFRFIGGWSGVEDNGNLGLLFFLFLGRIVLQFFIDPNPIDGALFDGNNVVFKTPRGLG